MSVNSLFNNTAATAANASSSAATSAAATAANASSSSGSSNLISENSFLNLMIKELENQDPTSPMSNMDYISELAQFNSMNELTSMNSTLQTLVSSQNGASLGSAVNLVGQSVQATGNSFSFSSGTPSQLAYSLPQDANSVSLDVYDSSGNLVYNANLGSQKSGPQSFAWDGLENSGQAAPSGTYTFSVGGTGASGSTVSGTTYAQATVVGLSNSSSGGVQLELNNGSTVPLSSVTNVG